MNQDIAHAIREREPSNRAACCAEADLPDTCAADSMPVIAAGVKIAARAAVAVPC